MRRFFLGIFTLLVLGIFVPQSSQAFDQRCFTKQQCATARGDIMLDKTSEADGFYTDTDALAACGVDGNKGKNAAGEEIGFCLPVSQSVTKISFGGKQSFANFGDFIQYIYKYGMWLAGITAVGLIIISGFQWAASGGNSDMIGSAKNRISGAVTGLILLALAYTILNTVNPYLVQLRLPQTWMINTIGLSPPYCSQVQDKKIAAIGPSEPPPNESQIELALTKAQKEGYSIEPKSGACGTDYLVDGAAKLSCQGDKCTDNNQTCTPLSLETGKAGKLIRKRDCAWGQIVYHLFISRDFFTSMKQIAGSDVPVAKWFLNRVNADGHWIDHDNLWITPACKQPNGKIVKGDIFEGTASELPPTGSNWFRMDFLPAALNKTDAEEYLVRVGGLNLEPGQKCISSGVTVGEVVGYVIGIELDAEAQLKDIKLMAGYENNKLIFAAADRIDYEKQYIPFSAIKQGIFSELPLNNTLINQMYASKK